MIRKEEERRNFGAFEQRDKEEARAAVKTLERFHYSERGSKTRRERPRPWGFKGFSALASLLYKSRKVDTKMRIYFYNVLLSRARPLKFYETKLNTRVSIYEFTSLYIN